MLDSTTMSIYIKGLHCLLTDFLLTAFRYVLK